MSRNVCRGATARRWKFHRIAVVSVSAATLFGLVGAGAGVAEAAALQPTGQPGPCTREEIGQKRIGPDGKLYVCRPRSSAGNSGSDDAQRLAELATDTSSGGEISTRSMRKARAMLGLEKAGLLSAPVRRDPTGAADFVDGRGVSWNAHDLSSSHQGGHNVLASVIEIGVDLLSGDNVILITDNLNTETTKELSAAVDSAGLSDRVLLWPGVSVSA